MPEWLGLTFIFFMAGVIQGMTGFGAGLLAMPLLAFYLDIRVAVPLCMLNGLLITGFLSLQLKNYVDWHKITPLLVGCLPGVVPGIVLLKKKPMTRCSPCSSAYCLSVMAVTGSWSRSALAAYIRAGPIWPASPPA